MAYPVEIIDWIQRLYRVDGISDGQMRCAIRFESGAGPDADILKKAVIASIEAIPILGTRYVDDGMPRWVSLDPAEFARAFVVARTEAEFEAFLQAGVEESRGPQVKLCLLDSRPAAVALNLNHMTSDGAGFRDYFYFLCTIYTRLMTDPGYRPMAISGDRSMRGVLDSIGIGAKLKSLVLQSTENNRAGDHCFPLGEGGSVRPLVMRRKLGRERMAAIRDYRRAHGATVNELVLCAFYRCLFQRLALGLGAEIRVPLTVDMRQYLATRREFKALANLTATAMTRLAYIPEEKFAGTLRRIKAELNMKRDGNIGLNAFAKLDMVLRIFGSRISHRVLRFSLKYPLISISNVGTLNPARMRFGDLRPSDVHVFAIKHKPYFQLMICSYEGELSLGVSLYGDDGDRERLASFLEEVDAELPNLA